MVMRNRYDGSGSPGWWDDLPPRVRSRFTNHPADEPEAPPALPPAEAPARPSALDWVRELSRLALLFVAVAVVNLAFLLLAISFLSPLTPAPVDATAP